MLPVLLLGNLPLGNSIITPGKLEYEYGITATRGICGFNPTMVPCFFRLPTMLQFDTRYLLLLLLLLPSWWLFKDTKVIHLSEVWRRSIYL